MNSSLHTIVSSPLSKVYRGLGRMLLPAQFWVPHGNPAWRGGVERAFMSTTADKSVALFYANGRGTVIEITVGRIQIGGDVSFLSMVCIPPSHTHTRLSLALLNQAITSHCPRLPSPALPCPPFLKAFAASSAFSPPGPGLCITLALGPRLPS
jgi:hypothetical protein